MSVYDNFLKSRDKKEEEEKEVKKESFAKSVGRFFLPKFIETPIFGEKEKKAPKDQGSVFDRFQEDRGVEAQPKEDRKPIEIVDLRKKEKPSVLPLDRISEIPWGSEKQFYSVETSPGIFASFPSDYDEIKIATTRELKNIEEKIKQAQQELGELPRPEGFREKFIDPTITTAFPGAKKTRDIKLKKKEIKNLEQAAKGYQYMLEQPKENKGFFEGFAEAFTDLELGQLIPFAGSIDSLQELETVIDANKRKKEGKDISSFEQSLLIKYRAKNLPVDKGLGYNVGSVVAQLPTFGAEFVATGGVYSLFKGGTKTLVTGLAPKFFAKKLPSLSVNLGSTIVGGAAQGFSNIPEVAEKTAQYMIPNADLVAGENGDILFGAIDKNGDSFDEAFKKALGTTAVEYITERAGIIVEKPLGFLQRAVLGKWLTKHGLGTSSKALDFVKGKVEWNGIIGEVFEEELSELFQAPIEDRDFKAPFLTPEGTERLLVETLAIGIFGGTAQVADITMRKIGGERKMQEIRPIEITPENEREVEQVIENLKAVVAGKEPLPPKKIKPAEQSAEVIDRILKGEEALRMSPKGRELLKDQLSKQELEGLKKIEEGKEPLPTVKAEEKKPTKPAEVSARIIERTLSGQEALRVSARGRELLKQQLAKEEKAGRVASQIENMVDAILAKPETQRTEAEVEIVESNQDIISEAELIQTTEEVKEVRTGEQIAKEVKDLGSDQGGISDFLADKISKENYNIETVNISELRKIDKDLDEFLKSGEVRRFEGKPFGMSPIVSSAGEVLDGYNRIAQALANRETQIEVLKGIKTVNKTDDVIEEKQLVSDIESAEKKLREEYISIREESEEALGEIWTELDMAEAGERIPVRDQEGNFISWLGKNSSFPNWIPDYLRSKKTFNKVLEGLDDLSKIKYPIGNRDNQRLLYDSILEELDSRLNIDTSETRKSILENYGKIKDKRIEGAVREGDERREEDRKPKEKPEVKKEPEEKVVPIKDRSTDELQLRKLVLSHKVNDGTDTDAEFDEFDNINAELEKRGVLKSPPGPVGYPTEAFSKFIPKERTLMLTEEEARKLYRTLYTVEESDFIFKKRIIEKGKEAGGRFSTYKLGDGYQALVEVVSKNGKVSDRDVYHEGFHVMAKSMPKKLRNDAMDEILDDNRHKEAVKKVVEIYEFPDNLDGRRDAAEELGAQGFATFNAGNKSFGLKVRLFYERIKQAILRMMGKEKKIYGIYRDIIKRRRPHGEIKFTLGEESYSLSPEALEAFDMIQEGDSVPERLNDGVKELKDEGILRKEFVPKKGEAPKKKAPVTVVKGEKKEELEEFAEEVVKEEVSKVPKTGLKVGERITQRGVTISKSSVIKTRPFLVSFKSGDKRITRSFANFEDAKSRFDSMVRLRAKGFLKRGELPASIQSTNTQKAQAHAIANKKNITTSQFKRIAVTQTGFDSMSKMTPEEADVFIGALKAIKPTFFGKITIPRTKGLVTQEEAERKFKNIRAGWLLNIFRTPRNVFREIGVETQAEQVFRGFQLRRDFNSKWFAKFNEWQKELGVKGGLFFKRKQANEQSQRMFRAINNPEEKVELSEKEAAIVTRARVAAEEVANLVDDARDEVGLDPINRRKNYITNLLTEESRLLLQKTKQAPNELLAMLSTRVPSSVFDRLLLERKGGLPIKEDFWQSLKAMIQIHGKYIHVSPPVHRFERFMKFYGDKIPFLSRKYITSRINRFLGKPTIIDSFLRSLDEAISDTIGKIPGLSKEIEVEWQNGLTEIIEVPRFTSNVAQKSLQKLKSLRYIYDLAFSVSFYTLNLTQFWLNTVPKLRGNPLDVYQSAFSGYAQMMVDFFRPSKWKYWRERGVLTEIDNVIDQEYKTSRAGADILNIFAKLSEFNNRVASTLAAEKNLQLLQKKGKFKQFYKELESSFGDEAEAYSRNIADITQFRYGLEEKPIFFDNPIADLYYQYNTFALKQIEFTEQLARNLEAKGILKDFREAHKQGKTKEFVADLTQGKRGDFIRYILNFFVLMLVLGQGFVWEALFKGIVPNQAEGFLKVLKGYWTGDKKLRQSGYKQVLTPPSFDLIEKMADFGIKATVLNAKAMKQLDLLRIALIGEGELETIGGDVKEEITRGVAITRLFKSSREKTALRNRQGWDLYFELTGRYDGTREDAIDLIKDGETEKARELAREHNKKAKEDLQKLKELEVTDIRLQDNIRKAKKSKVVDSDDFKRWIKAAKD